jgi:hypothetical protein
MLFMNEYEIDSAVIRFATDSSTPNLGTAALALQRLARWADSNSDGWHSWPKPCRAAKRLQEVLQAADRFDPQDCTAAELRSALTPVKSFLTRQGASLDLISQ